MKYLVLSIFMFSSAMWCADGNEPSDPLDRQIPDSYSYKSFDDAVHQIEEKTGFKVTCPKHIADFMGSISLQDDLDLTVAKKPTKENQTVKMFLDDIVHGLALKWVFNPEHNVVELDF